MSNFDLKKEQQEVKDLVEKVIDGDYDAFVKLEGLAKPLMTNLSDYFSNLHYKFEFEDFYSICMNALYEACLKYNPKNPSFLSYAKCFMLRQCWRELEYWNAEMRNIFDNKEVSFNIQLADSDHGLLSIIEPQGDMVVDDIVIVNEFSNDISDIIHSIFEGNKEKVMDMYILRDMSPKEISVETGLHYQKVYAIIRRGKDKVVEEYKKRYP